MLTTAGTSMENGKHGGKTRSELWDSYNKEIEEISSVFITELIEPLQEQINEIRDQKDNKEKE